MLKTIEAAIDEDGVVHLSEAVDVKNVTRVLVIVMDDEAIVSANESMHFSKNMSEQALAKDWNNKDEDEAWSYLGHENS